MLPRPQRPRAKRTQPDPRLVARADYLPLSPFSERWPDGTVSVQLRGGKKIDFGSQQT